MQLVSPPQTVEKPEAPVEHDALAEKSVDQTAPASPAERSIEPIAPASPHSDEKAPVEAQLAPYPASPDPTTPHTPHTAASTFESSDTDKIALPTAMAQYSHDPAQQSPAPFYPDHTGSTSPQPQYTIQPDHAGPTSPQPQYTIQPDHAGSTSPQPQYTIQPDHAYGQPGYDQNQYYAQQQQPRGQPAGQQQYQTATPFSQLNRSPAPADCLACGARAMTLTQFETGNTTHAWAFGACVCLCLGCIPYLMSSTKDVQHKCSKCGALLATWHRSGSTEVHMHA